MTTTYPQRRSLRLQNYDYSQSGAYFVTICTQGRIDRFGSIEGDVVQLTDAGALVAETWEALPDRFPNLELDAFIVMPNHMHGILLIDEHGTARIPAVIGAFKSISTHRYIQGVRDDGWPRFEGTLWQRNYYEHVLRSEERLNRARAYIADNQLRWILDPENVSKSG